MKAGDDAAEAAAAAAAAATAAAPATAPVPKGPIGKCVATNPTLDAGAVKQWSGWCEDQCKPPSGSPQNCLTPEMTGAAACVCGGAGAEG